MNKIGGKKNGTKSSRKSVKNMIKSDFRRLASSHGAQPRHKGYVKVNFH